MSVPRTSRRSATSKRPASLSPPLAITTLTGTCQPSVSWTGRPTSRTPITRFGGPAEGVGDGVTGGASDGGLAERLGLASAAAVVAPWRVTRSGVSEPSVETSKAAFAAPSWVGANTIDSSQLAPGSSCVPVHGESTSWNAVTSSMPMLVIRSGRVPAVIRTVWAADRSPTWTVEKTTSPGEIEAVVPPGLTRSQATTAATARTPTASGRSHFADRPPRPVAVAESCSTSFLGSGIASASRTARFCCVALNPGRSPIWRRISRARVRLFRASVRRPSTASWVPT